MITVDPRSLTYGTLRSRHGGAAALVDIDEKTGKARGIERMLIPGAQG